MYGTNTREKHIFSPKEDKQYVICCQILREEMAINQALKIESSCSLPH